MLVAFLCRNPFCVDCRLSIQKGRIEVIKGKRTTKKEDIVDFSAFGGYNQNSVS